MNTKSGSPADSPEASDLDAGQAPASYDTPPGTGTRKGRKARGDLRFRLAYTKPELSLLLPFGHTTLEEMIKRGAFPDGLRPHPTAHRIWSRRVIEDWLDAARRRGLPPSATSL